MPHRLSLSLAAALLLAPTPMHALAPPDGVRVRAAPDATAEGFWSAWATAHKYVLKAVGDSTLLLLPQERSKQ